MNKTPTLAFALVGLVLQACASSTPFPSSSAYVRAQATVDPPRPKPVVVEVPVAPGASNPERPIPPPALTSDHAPKSDASPEQVIDDANRRAAEGPSPSGYFHAIMEYAFSPGSLFQVYAAPMRVTDLVLQPGEKILGQPASGDVVRWVLAVGKSMDHGVEQAHVYIKPTRPDLETNLAINTDRRTYLMELHSFKDTYMAAVKWTYPEDEMAELETEAARQDALDRNSAPVVSVDALNFKYAIRVVNGEPRWRPLQVFDDGKKTFIRFPADMLAREAPALFVWRNKETELVNYRVRSDLYVVDRLFDSAELRLGQQDQEVVRVERTGH